MINEKIVDSCWKAIRGRMNVPAESGQCLSLVRRIVENAHYGGHYMFYGDYLVAGSTLRKGKHVGQHLSDPWAVDLEASVKVLGYPVKLEDRQPGDIIFNHRSARPYGHVGLLIDSNTVLENINPWYRKNSLILPSYLALTPLDKFPRTLIARLRDR